MHVRMCHMHTLLAMCSHAHGSPLPLNKIPTRHSQQPAAMSNPTKTEA